MRGPDLKRWRPFCVGRRSGKLNLFWRTRHMDMKSRELLGGATLAAAWAAGGVDIANDAFAASAPAGKIPGGDPERKKRLLRDRRADATMPELPSAHPTQAGKINRASQVPLGGLS